MTGIQVERTLPNLHGGDGMSLDRGSSRGEVTAMSNAMGRPCWQLGRNMSAR